uniref:Copper(I)-binding protein n=1 Tax=Candidatus Kentrum sp. LPFa TaxID=2126335 RepID=A0A450X7N5_9GAMM|nr:MAG: hypothetical protein BECKLPF1236A_GA0070988_1002116 [Candidatus Kentron sp. LPFa]VFK25263.1 MAG: hypothetical protein BECKLPF1236C_GA0070990_1002016 [Candidatus Kentron sp. LPFa]
MHKIAISLLLFIWTVPAWAANQAEPNITVTDSWIREAPPGAKALAGYMLLHNHGDADVSLVSASCPDFDAVMLHETVERDKMATMVHLDRVRIPAQKQVAFAPGGKHLMLMQPKRAIVAGEESTVTLVFASGAKVIAKFKVKKPFSDNPKAHGKKHH